MKKDMYHINVMIPRSLGKKVRANYPWRGQVVDRLRLMLRLMASKPEVADKLYEAMKKEVGNGDA